MCDVYSGNDDEFEIGLYLALIICYESQETDTEKVQFVARVLRDKPTNLTDGEEHALAHFLNDASDATELARKVLAAPLN